MLVGVPIITHIVIEIVGVGEEQIIFRKNETTAQIDIGQINFLRILGRQYLLILICKASTGFVPQI
jgi:hypothetical protein